MKSKSEVTKLLLLLVEALEDISEAEFEQLLSGSGRLTFESDNHKPTKAQRTRNTRKTSQEELEALLEQLKICQTRDEVREILTSDSRVSSKTNLGLLAKMLRVHVQKIDRREAIENKIAESVIGVRLRSEAIRGVNLKKSSSAQDEQ